MIYLRIASYCTTNAGNDNENPHVVDFSFSKLARVISQVEDNLCQTNCRVVAGTALDRLKIDLWVEGEGGDKRPVKKKFFRILWILSFSYNASEKEKETTKQLRKESCSVSIIILVAWSLNGSISRNTDRAKWHDPFRWDACLRSFDLRWHQD